MAPLEAGRCPVGFRWMDFVRCLALLPTTGTLPEGMRLSQPKFSYDFSALLRLRVAIRWVPFASLIPMLEF